MIACGLRARRRHGAGSVAVLLRACALLLVIAGQVVAAEAVGDAMAAAAAGDDGRGVAGLWLTEGGRGRVEIYPVEDSPGYFEGRIASGEDGPDAPRDSRNPDPALRDRAIKGLIFLTGFRYVGDGRYEEGRIYDPQSGNTYRGKLRLESTDELVLRGYLGISLFGASQTWTRLPEPGASGQAASAQGDAGPVAR